MAITFPPSRFPPSPGSPWHIATPEQIEAHKRECDAVRVQLHREKYSEGLPKAWLECGPHRRDFGVVAVLAFVAGVAITWGALT